MKLLASLLLALQLVATGSLQYQSPAGAGFTLKALAAQGIVVPKRSALISGLNSQFKVKPNKTSLLPPVNGVQPEVAAAAAAPASAAPLPEGLFRPLPFNWLPGRSGAKKNQQQQQQVAAQGGLYLDRHQQEILAANPNLLNPSASAFHNNAGQILSTRSDPLQANTPINNEQPNNPQAPAGSRAISATSDPQLYRGFSLIELEVKSDADRRYVQDLYANLTAAINEQAANPNIVAVSPYVDVDFWSFKYALNDQIDIMVSPKSRAFMLNQLSRAKIRHRIKIDDIQTRLDQQQQQQQASPAGLNQQAESPGSISRELPPAEQLLSGRQSALHHNNQRHSEQLRPRQAPGSNETLPAGRPMNESLFFDNYQRMAEINQYVEGILERNRDVAQVKVIGRSSQGRYLRVLKLGYDQTDLDGSTSSNLESLRRQASSSQPIQNNASNILDSFFRKQESVQKVGTIWLDGGTHAREWISPATVLYIAFRLSDNHNRCRKFFDTLRVVVSQSEAENSVESSRVARRYSGQSKPLSASLNTDLLSGINEINSSLLGAKPKQSRPRTELEHTLELLAKSPQEVASEYGCDLEIEALLRRYTFLIMPVLNPDGYEYSHTHNRLWRKTRSQSNHPIYRHFCLGADPNRNYDARHGATGSSTHPCSQTYAGTVPFTEPETRHQSNFVYANRNNMKMFISFHSYSQMILLPYSHSTQLPPDHKDLDSVGQAAVKAIERTHGTIYRVGPSAAILYTASGTASDWAYEKAGVKYSYTIELRDTGTYGFLLPRQQIIPTGEETFNGLLAMIGQMEKNERLLTSKSSLVPQTTPNRVSGSELSHVPNLDNLNAAARHKNQRPNLENVLDNGQAENQSQNQIISGPVNGARDRRPEELNGDDLRLASTADPNSIYHHAYTGSSPYEPEPLQLDQAGNRLYPDDTFHDEHESDSGYAFEGEGELMEPTRDNIVQSERISAELRLAGRQEHSRRIVQAAGLSSSGRSLINSPLAGVSGGSAPEVGRRRESSEALAQQGKPN